MPLPPPTFPRAELERFFGAAHPLVMAKFEPVTGSRRALTKAFADLGHRLARHRHERAGINRRDAPQFNQFDFIKPKETMLSGILRFLLNPSGTHGQGGLFLKLLLARLRPEGVFDAGRASLVPEAPTYTLGEPPHRRIDLVVTMPGFVLAFENKKYTGEGHRQIEDYCKHLSNVAHQDFCLIFLTRTGEDAQMSEPGLSAKYRQDGQLVLWTWQSDIQQWLTDCRIRCGSGKVRHFLHDFADYIQKFLTVATPLPEQDEQPS